MILCLVRLTITFLLACPRPKQEDSQETEHQLPLKAKASFVCFFVFFL